MTKENKTMVHRTITCMHGNKMGTMAIPKLVSTMSLPIMVSMLVQSLYNIVDSVFVSRISESALAATSIAYSAQMLQIAVAVGTGVGVNALVSRMLGARKYQEANEAATTGLYLTVLSSLGFVCWGIFFTEPFVRIFTENEVVVENAKSYLSICQIWCTGIFLGTFTQRLLQSTGRTVSSMLAQVAGAVVNMILDPLLIFGIAFFPEMGITGAAVATVIGQWVAAVIGILLNVLQNKEVRLVWKGFRLQKRYIADIYRVGAPTILMQAFGSIMVGVMNMILNMFSVTAVAFFGVYFKLQSFLFMPMNGLGQGSLPIVGFNYGAKQYGRVKETCKMSLITGASLGLVGTLIFLIFTQELLSLFSASEEMIRIGVPALRIIAITFVFTSVTMISGYIISGLGNGLVNMSSAAIRQLIVLLPLVFVFGKMGGISKVWFAFWVAELLAFFFAVYQLSERMKYFTKEGTLF